MRWSTEQHVRSYRFRCPSCGSIETADYCAGCGREFRERGSGYDD